MAERSERLAEAEQLVEGIRAALNTPGMRQYLRRLSYYDDRPCADCGVVTYLHCRAERCEECAQRRARERQTTRQRRRRARKAGLLIGRPGGFFQMRASRDCQHCGEPFVPRRTTARFCSPKCRVAAHRARK